MDRRMWAELRALFGRIVGARVGETAGHLVNGVGLSTINHAQDLKSITIHLVSPTTIARATQERKEERECVNVDRGWYALCSWGERLIKEKREEPVTGYRNFLPDTKPDSAGLSTSGTIVFVIVVQAEVQSYTIDVRSLRRISTMYRRITIYYAIIINITENCFSRERDFNLFSDLCRFNLPFSMTFPFGFFIGKT